MNDVAINFEAGSEPQIIMETSQKNILIVDDEPDNLQYIFDTFQEAKAPYKISKAPSGEIALKMIARNKPDIIITDWDMPEMSGVELIKNIKRLDADNEIPVIMCTGAMLSSEHLKVALDAGAMDYVRKPIDKVELLSRTQSALLLAESKKQIVAQNLELKKLNSTKDKFFSIIAHDLRTPVGAVMGLAELMKDGLEDFSKEELREYVHMMHDATKSGFQLLENLLEWSRHQIGNRVYTPKVFNLEEIIETTLLLMVQNAKEKQLTLSRNLCSECLAYGDLDMVSAVIRNFLSNAIKFTPEGGTITVHAKSSADEIKVSVADTGVGISAENIEKLFAIDQHFSSAGTNEEQGTGIGLSLCQEFMHEHGSEITVESEIGKGSTFSFVLPLGV